MIILRYDLIGAYKEGISIHPQEKLKELGLSVTKFEGSPISDSVFVEVNKLPDPMPGYLKIENNFHFTDER